MFKNQDDLNDRVKQALSHFDGEEVHVTMIVTIPPDSKLTDVIVTSEQFLADVIPYLCQVLVNYPTFPQGLTQEQVNRRSN